MSFGKISRRKFLRQAGCTGMGTATFLSSYNSLSLINKLIGTSSAPPSDYKALVCILLAGGNDSYNMLVPKGNSEYSEYAATRGNLALQQNELLAINPNTGQGKDLGVHPDMPDVQQLFENGNLAFVANAGTLVEPVPNATAFNSGNYELPLGLYSHSDQIQQWQTAFPQNREAIGWGGKMADLLKTMNTSQNISMNISLSGRNVFQSGNTVLEYSISNEGDGVSGIREIVPHWYSNNGFMNRMRNQVVKDLATEMYANVFQETLGTVSNQTLETFEEFKLAVSGVNINTDFSGHYTSQNMKMMARVIGARNELGMNRQTFFMNMGGWDHHDDVLPSQQVMLGQLNNAISEFYTSLEELGVEDKVTIFTISDFGRTLTSNGNGSDHAWGGNTIVAGGAVNGKDIYGSYPDLHLSGNPLVVSNRGNLIPTTAADLYFAELALWFGVQPSDLPLILPNISNFYNINSGVNPLGFLT